MTNLLLLTTSLNTKTSVSNQLANEYCATLASKTEIQLTVRDLADDALPHLTSEEMQAWSVDPSERNEEQSLLAQRSDDLIAELQSADEVVIALPMYNFSSPSVFKTWIDRVARAGVTFKYTPDGPQGLLKNKKVTFIFSRGGVYSNTPADTQTPYVTNFMKFIGITNIQYVFAEGLALGEESAKNAISAAKEKIIELIETAVD